MLKVGFTTDTNNGIFVATARHRAKRRGWDADGIRCIWKRPGETRTEAWMQATLAFRWRPAFEQRSMKICEWFAVPDLTAEEVVAVLDEIYEAMPADQARLSSSHDPAARAS